MFNLSSENAFHFDQSKILLSFDKELPYFVAAFDTVSSMLASANTPIKVEEAKVGVNLVIKYVFS